MFKASKAHTRLLTAVALMALPALVSAQGYYDDDIYYNPSKKKKENTTVQQNTATSRQTTQYEYVDYPAADQYVYSSTSTRDIDEYNRHGQFLVSDSVANDTIETDVYTNTRRIQRFHNNDVIDYLNDDDYATYVLTDPTQVNIYINDPFYPSYYSPYYRLYPYSWGWNGYYSPWLNYTWGIYDPWFWGPSWSWTWGPSWGWGPSWSWGPSWAWGPGCGPGWGCGPGMQQAWRPTPAGSSRPHAYAGAGASNARPSTVRPVSTASTGRLTNTSRNGASAIGNRYPASNDRVNIPSNSNTGTPIVGGSTSRGRNSGSSTTNTHVSTSGKNTGSGNVSTGRGSGSNNNSSTSRGSSNTSRGSSSSTTRGSSSSTTRSSSSSSSSSSYNRGSSSTSRSSSGSYGGGGSSSRGGGSSHSGGGGGGRGRR